jgi:hypothetical protein
VTQRAPEPERGADTVLIDPTAIGGRGANSPTEKQYFTLPQAMYEHIG